MHRKSRSIRALTLHSVRRKPFASASSMYLQSRCRVNRQNMLRASISLHSNNTASVYLAAAAKHSPFLVGDEQVSHEPNGARKRWQRREGTNCMNLLYICLAPSILAVVLYGCVAFGTEIAVSVRFNKLAKEESNCLNENKNLLMSAEPNV
jgi:hypothetical protein